MVNIFGLVGLLAPSFSGPPCSAHACPVIYFTCLQGVVPSHFDFFRRHRSQARGVRRLGLSLLRLLCLEFILGIAIMLRSFE
jgi:hypothetical protein